MAIFQELNRRNVFRVAVGYVVISWLLLQVGDTLAPALRLPDWVNSALAFFLILGFPVALFLAWAYELTPDGLKRDHEVEQGDSRRLHNARKLDRLIIVVLLLALGYFAVERFLGPATTAVPVTSQTSVEADGPALQAVAANNQAPAAPHERSIAVLPFVNLSSDPEQEYFSDGLSEELLNLLARMPELQVTSRSSAFAFKGKEINIPEVASQLRVAHVLEGSVRKSGDRLRITAQLIDADRDVHLWSETYDRTLDDVFAIQDEIAGSVVDALRIQLLGEAPRARVLDPEAHDLNLQGRFFWLRRGSGDIERARSYYERSLEIDSENAPAWAALAIIYQVLANSGGMDREDGLRLSLEAAEAAVAADPEYAPGHVRLAWARFRQGDEEAARRHREIAFQLDPNDSLVLFDRANQLMSNGQQDAAIKLYERLYEMDPLSAVNTGNLASFYVQAGRYEDAQVMIKRTWELSPDHEGIQNTEATLHYLLGHLDRALEAARGLPSDNDQRVLLACIHHARGEAERSQQYFEAIQGMHRQLPPQAFQLRVHGCRGESDAAFRLMDMARQAGIHFSAFIHDPLLASLHADPRWDEALRAMGYVPAEAGTS